MLKPLRNSRCSRDPLRLNIGSASGNIASRLGREWLIGPSLSDERLATDIVLSAATARGSWE